MRFVFGDYIKRIVGEEFEVIRFFFNYGLGWDLKGLEYNLYFLFFLEVCYFIRNELILRNVIDVV